MYNLESSVRTRAFFFCRAKRPDKFDLRGVSRLCAESVCRGRGRGVRPHPPQSICSSLCPRTVASALRNFESTWPVHQHFCVCFAVVFAAMNSGSTLTGLSQVLRQRARTLEPADAQPDADLEAAIANMDPASLQVVMLAVTNAQARLRQVGVYHKHFCLVDACRLDYSS